MPEGSASFRARRAGWRERVTERARFTRAQVVGAVVLALLVAGLVLFSRVMG